jgi:hypothetical protein
MNLTQSPGNACEDLYKCKPLQQKCQRMRNVDFNEAFFLIDALTRSWDRLLLRGVQECNLQAMQMKSRSKKWQQK